MKRLVYAIGTAFVVCSMTLAEDQPKTVTDAAQVAGISVQELARTFATNEVRAEAVYVGKQVTIRGAVVRVIHSRYRVSEDGKHAYVVELKADEQGPSTICVKFYFDKGDRAQLAELQAGQELRIQGLCERPAVYTGDRRQNQKDYVEVPIRECKLIQGK